MVKPAKADAAEIMGGEDLRVYMEVDYIRFRKPPADDAAMAPAPRAQELNDCHDPPTISHAEKSGQLRENLDRHHDGGRTGRRWMVHLFKP